MRFLSHSFHTPGTRARTTCFRVGTSWKRGIFHESGERFRECSAVIFHEHIDGTFHQIFQGRWKLSQKLPWKLFLWTFPWKFRGRAFIHENS